ncbi:MAG: hypothetical protein U0132_21560 [Gemmatimonadaceae bacterium]
MSDDDKFDTWLQSAAKTYHEPPDRTPRLEMWDEIEHALDAAQVTPLAAPRERAARWRRWSAPLSAIAAALLVAVGVGTGYWLRGRAPNTPVAPAVAAATPAGKTNVTLDVALQQHMANAEALLVAYRGVDTSTDAHVRSWARDVLGTTRLLMDSPAASDPSRRRLLEDLELILVQIVQLPDSLPKDDRTLIDRSLSRDQLLTRLRTAIPAGIVSGT